MKISVKQVSGWQDLPPILIETWEEMVENSSGLDLLYQTPLWFEHLLAQNSGSKCTDLFLAQLTDYSGNLLGVVPLQVHIHYLKFDISAYALAKIPMRVASVLGSQLPVSDNKALYLQVVKAIFNALPECDAIYFDCVPSDSPVWGFLTNADWKKTGILFYAPEGATPYHFLVLPATFDKYLSRFKRKKRYNLNRQVKAVRAAGGDDFKWLLVEKEEQVESFLRKAEKISQRSWQYQRIGTRVIADKNSIKKFHDLAKRGILRCYLLSVGEPCAFIIGFQYGDVYHYVEIGYDKSFAKYSPGTVLLYLLIENLIAGKNVSKVNFGIGHAAYKQQFGTHHIESVSAFLLRKTFRNLFFQTCHSCFRRSIKKIRSWQKADKY